MTVFNREQLLEVLDRCRPGLASGGLLPELTHLWFDQKNVYAYNGGLGIRQRLPTDISAGIPGRPLLDLLKTSKLEKASITRAGTTTLIKMGRSEIKLVSISDTDRRVWPFPNVLPKEEGLAVNDKVFDAMKTLAFLKQGKANQAIHFGVVVMVTHDAINLYAADGRSIAMVSVKAKSVTMPQFLVPWEMVSTMGDMLKGKENAQLWLMPDCVVAGSPGTMIGSNLVDLKGSQDVVGIMKTRFGGKMLPLPKGLGPLLERAVILAGKDEPLITLSMAKGQLRLTGKYALGAIDETLELDRVGASVKAKLPADVIVRALPLAETFNLHSSTVALGGPNFQYVVATKE